MRPSEKSNTGGKNTGSYQKNLTKIKPMEKYKNIFIEEMGIRSAPNNHDTVLFSRAKRYIAKTSWIPGIEMIAVVNSLSMYATHPDSDIDLFILTRK